MTFRVAVLIQIVDDKPHQVQGEIAPQQRSKLTIALESEASAFTYKKVADSDLVRVEFLYENTRYFLGYRTDESKREDPSDFVCEFNLDKPESRTMLAKALIATAMSVEMLNDDDVVPYVLEELVDAVRPVIDTHGHAVLSRPRFVALSTKLKDKFPTYSMGNGVVRRIEPIGRNELI